MIFLISSLGSALNVYPLSLTVNKIVKSACAKKVEIMNPNKGNAIVYVTSMAITQRMVLSRKNEKFQSPLVNLLP